MDGYLDCVVIRSVGGEQCEGEYNRIVTEYPYHNISFMDLINMKTNVVDLMVLSINCMIVMLNMESPTTSNNSGILNIIYMYVCSVITVMLVVCILYNPTHGCNARVLAKGDDVSLCVKR